MTTYVSFRARRELHSKKPGSSLWNVGNMQLNNMFAEIIVKMQVYEKLL